MKRNYFIIIITILVFTFIGCDLPDPVETATEPIVPTGSVWTTRTLPVSAGWSAITYGNGLFVTVANDGAESTTAATSP